MNKGIPHTWGPNGELIVNATDIVASEGFKKQIAAAAKLTKKKSKPKMTDETDAQFILRISTLIPDTDCPETEWRTTLLGPDMKRLFELAYEFVDATR